jgi:hypothetical protein
MKIVSGPENEFHIRKLKTIARSFKVGIAKANIDIGNAHTKELKRQFSLPKHGRWYTKEYKGRYIPHRASKAGEALAIWTGELFKTVNFKTHGWESLTVEYGSADTAYGKYWEELAPARKKRRSMKITVKEQERNTEEWYKWRIGNELNPIN